MGKLQAVVIHGVAVRRDEADERDREGEERRRALLEGLVWGGCEVHDLYWGDLGARLRWNGLSVPRGSLQSFGSSPDEPPLWVDPFGQPGRSLVNLARTRRGRAAVADLAALGAALLVQAQPRELVRLHEGLEAVAQEPWPWLAEVEDDEGLSREVQASLDRWEAKRSPGLEAFGWRDLAAEGLLRISGRILNAASDASMLLMKPGAAFHATRFLGDVMVYLDGRRAGHPGPIGERILAGLQAAFLKAREGGQPLVVVAHSFGAFLMLDLAASYPHLLGEEFQVDLLVTVGAQVGLFQELDLLRKKLSSYPVEQGEKVPRPDCILRWLNVLDLADPLAFRCSPIFHGVEDVEMNAEVGILRAHQAYFDRPSFYTALRKRLGAEGLLR